MNKVKIFCLMLLCFLCNQIAIASEPEVFKLSNGHTVVLQQIPNSKLVCVDTWVKTGSVNETDANTGVAHFLEHLFFKGSSKYKAGEFERILDGKGAIYNAATSKDFTHFYITIKKEDLPLALDLQSNMLLTPLIPQYEMDKERLVVLEEISRSKDNPNNIVFQNMNSILFKTHPYKREVIGTADVIKKISRTEVFSFYNKWYVPENMVTVIIGNINKDNALELASKYFVCQRSKSMSLSPQSKYTREAELSKKETKIQRGRYNTAYLEMAFKGCEFKNTKDTYAMDLLAIILGQGKTSYLYKALKENKNLVTYVDAGHYSLRDDSIFYISAGLNSGNYSVVEKEIIKQIDEIRSKGVTAEELKKAKNILERSYIYSNESVEDIANTIGYNMTLGNDLKYYKNYIEEVKKINEKDILNVANQYLNPEKMAISLLLPEKTKLGANSCGYTPKHIAARADGLLTFNYKPQTNQLSKNPPLQVYKNTAVGGAQLIIEKNDNNDIVAVEIFIKGGEFLAKPGVCNVLVKTLLRGTKTASAQEISQNLEDSGIIISPSVNPDYIQISVKSTKADFDKAFGILKDIMNNANFPEAEVVKAKKDIIDGIKFQQDQPKTVALDMLKAQIYPKKAYGYSMEDVKATMPNITRADPANYYYSYFAPQNMAISVCGNVDVCDIRKKFDNFVTRQGKPVDIKTFVIPFTPLEHDLKVTTKKRTQSAWVMTGRKVCGVRDEKDFAVLKVINSILSGGMSSRLFVDLREKKGLAYEVGCFYPTFYNNSYFVLYIGTNPKNIALVQQEFKNQINTLMVQPVSEGELFLAKQRLIGYLALSQETNSQRAFERGRYELFSKGYNFTDKYEKLIESVSADDIIKVANKYFKQPSVVATVEPIED